MCSPKTEAVMVTNPAVDARYAPVAARGRGWIYGGARRLPDTRIKNAHASFAL